MRSWFCLLRQKTAGLWGSDLNTQVIGWIADMLVEINAGNMTKELLKVIKHSATVSEAKGSQQLQWVRLLFHFHMCHHSIHVRATVSFQEMWGSIKAQTTEITGNFYPVNKLLVINIPGIVGEERANEFLTLLWKILTETGDWDGIYSFNIWKLQSCET